jgi:hypothetical protein
MAVVNGKGMKSRANVTAVFETQWDVKDKVFLQIKDV